MHHPPLAAKKARDFPVRRRFPRIPNFNFAPPRPPSSLIPRPISRPDPTRVTTRPPVPPPASTAATSPAHSDAAQNPSSWPSLFDDRLAFCDGYHSRAPLPARPLRPRPCQHPATHPHLLFAPSFRLSREAVATKGYFYALLRQCRKSEPGYPQFSPLFSLTPVGTSPLTCRQDIDDRRITTATDSKSLGIPQAKKNFHNKTARITALTSTTKKITPKSTLTTRLPPAIIDTPPARARVRDTLPRASSLCRNDNTTPAGRTSRRRRHHPKAWILTSTITATLVVAGPTGAPRPRGPRGATSVAAA